ncbi:MAG: protease inhibitor I42 family protein, partial [Spirochaetaceae bacterium]|nr:protease inhibitor I42 family protein [Spirochaetaceae bacterium]
LTDITHEPAPPNILGASSKIHYTFQAVKAGKGAIQFATYRPWPPFNVCYEAVLPIDIESGESGRNLTGLAGLEGRLGGWSKFAPPSADGLAALKEAAGGEIGDLAPLLESSQMVYGSNYIFAANLTIRAIKDAVRPVLLRVYKKPNEAAVCIGRETPGFPVPGSTWSSVYSPLGAVSSEQKKLLDEAMKGWAGSGFEALFAASRPYYSGVLFAGNLSHATLEEAVAPALLVVEVPAGRPVIGSIEEVYDLV